MRGLQPLSLPFQFRQAKEEYRSDYAATRPGRFLRTRRGLHGSADAHYASELDFTNLRELVRDMDRNDPLIGPLNDRVADNHTQGGYKLEFDTGDEKIDRDLWQRMNDWMLDPDQCDISGVYTFPEFEWLIARQEVVDGDIFGIGLETGELQLLEADRCRTPQGTRRNVVHGVLLNQFRRPLEYWFTKENLDPLKRINRVADIHRIPAARDEEGFRQVFHVHKTTRASQTRGITWYSGVAPSAGMYDDTSFSILVKLQMAAMLMGSIESEQGGPPTGNTQMGARDTVIGASGNEKILEEMSPGAIFRPPPGTTFKMQSSQVPSGQEMAYLKKLEQIIALPIGLPLVTALLDASETNFSGHRGAQNQAQIGFIRHQERRKAQWYHPITHMKVRHFLAEDRALLAASKRQGIDIFRHIWKAPRWKSIQPKDDAISNTMRASTGQASLSRIHDEQGTDFEDEVRISVRDRGYWIRESIKELLALKKEYPGDVTADLHWRDLYHCETPGVALQKATQAVGEEDAPAAAKPAKPAGGES